MHLDCFQCFAIIKNAAIHNLDIYTFVLLEVYFQGKFLEAELLGQKVNAYADLLDVAKFLSMRFVPPCIPASNTCESACFPTVSSRDYTF